METFQQPANQVSFVPRGVAARYNTALPYQGIQILQNPATYDSLLSDMVRGGAVDPDPRSGFDDPLASQILLAISNEMEGGLADGLNTALAVQITRRFVDPSAIALMPSNRLSGEWLNRVQDYIEAHLDDDLDRVRRSRLSPWVPTFVGMTRQVMLRLIIEDARLDRIIVQRRRSSTLQFIPR